MERRKARVEGEDEGEEEEEEETGLPFLCDGVALRWASSLLGWQVREGGREGRGK